MIYVARVDPTTFLPLPSRGSPNSAGFDLCSTDVVTVRPHERELIDTGFVWELPANSVGFVKPRSGLALNNGLDVMAGVIDSDYRGELKVLLINHGNRPVSVNRGDRIAQLVILGLHPVVNASQAVEEVDEIVDTWRGTGGFGSTGV